MYTPLVHWHTNMVKMLNLASCLSEAVMQEHNSKHVCEKWNNCIWGTPIGTFNSTYVHLLQSSLSSYVMCMYHSVALSLWATEWDLFKLAVSETLIVLLHILHANLVLFSTSWDVWQSLLACLQEAGLNSMVNHASMSVLVSSCSYFTVYIVLQWKYISKSISSGTSSVYMG